MGVLLAYSEKDERHRGNYKTASNSVTALDASRKRIGVVFETATPFDTPRLMSELVAWLQEVRDTKRLHPLLVIGVFVVVFLEIHPVQDGNGRLSRILDHARNHGRVTIGDVIRVTGSSRNTLKEHFRRLLEQGHLVRHGKGKGCWHALP